MFYDREKVALRFVGRDYFNKVHNKLPHEFDMVPDKYKITLHPSMERVVTEEYCEDYRPKEKG